MILVVDAIFVGGDVLRKYPYLPGCEPLATWVKVSDPLTHFEAELEFVLPYLDGPLKDDHNCELFVCKGAHLWS